MKVLQSRMDEFRNFIAKYPLIKEDVLNGKKTWQQIYENWVLLGEQDEIWNTYRTNTEVKNNSSNTFNNMFKSDNMKQVWNYVKKINPDNVSKTLGTVQKVLQITQSFGSKPGSGLYNANYNSWWE